MASKNTCIMVYDSATYIHTLGLEGAWRICHLGSTCTLLSLIIFVTTLSLGMLTSGYIYVAAEACPAGKKLSL